MSHCIVFIDSNIAEYQSLIPQLPEGTETIILNAARDGVMQILEALRSKSAIDAIDIISHGEPGALMLGSSKLSQSNLAEHAGQLTEIGMHLSGNADILLYGCEVAKGKQGKAFIEQLSLLTGANVAASTNLTGAAKLGGDWMLEAQIGSIQAKVMQLYYESVLAIINGTSGNDTLDGTTEDDSLYGLGGHDILTGYGGNDYLEGGDGSDRLSGGVGDDILIGGTAGTNADASDNFLNGDAGNDTLWGGDNAAFIDILNGGAGSDTLYGLAGIDSFVENGADSFNAVADTNLLDGGDGNDFFRAYSSDTIDSYTLTGGTGSDCFYLSNQNNSAISITDFTVGSGGDILDISELLNNSTGYSSGNPFDPTLGYLRLVQSGADAILQWDRDGAAIATNTWKTVVTLKNIDLAATPLTQENFTPVASPDGSSTGIILTGDAGDNILDGSVVNDSLYGLGGNDFLKGYGGNDTLEGGDGRDFLYGNAGDDTLKGGNGFDFLDGGAGDDTLEGGEGRDSDELWGGAGNDNLVGGAAGTNADAGNNTLFGEAGNDTLTGGDNAAYSDSLDGGAGSDTIYGLAGNDFLYKVDDVNGVADVDLLDGGSGNDSFYVRSYDTIDSSVLTGGTDSDQFHLYYDNRSTFSITDFTVGAGGDILDINLLLNVSTGYRSGNPFDPILGYLRLVQSGTDAILQWDKDGAAVAANSWKTVVTLKNIDLAATPLTQENFAPATPPEQIPALTGTAATLTNGVEDTSYTVTKSSLLQGWTDADGDTLSVQNLTANHGTVIVNPDNTYTIQAEANYNGLVTLSYQVSGGADATAASLGFNVTAVNDAPSFTTGANQTVDEDSGAQTVTGWATGISQGPTDESGQTATFITTNDNNGLFAVQPSIDANGNLSYTPAANAYGTTTVTASLQDNGGIANGGSDTSGKQTFTITVNPVNDAPVISAPDTQTITEDIPLVFSTANGNAITLSDVDAGSNLVRFQPSLVYTSSGTLSLPASSGLTIFGNGTTSLDIRGTAVDINAALALNGLVFTPSSNYNGFTTIGMQFYDLGSSGSGGFLSTSASVNVNISSVNDAPSFTTGANQTVDEDSGAQTVTGWASGISQGALDEIGQTITFTSSNDNNVLFAVQPSIDASGNLTYTPAANVYGAATVTVSLKDNGGTANGGNDTSAEQTYTITVNPVNDAPMLTGTVAALPDGSEGVNYPILATDLLQGWSDVDDATLVVTGLSANHGTIVDNGGGSYTLQPEANYNGPVSLSYSVSDGINNIAAALEFNLTAVNDAPQLTGPAATLVNGFEDTDYAINDFDLLLGWDDAENDAMSVINLVADHGTVIVHGDGTYTLQPENNYHGSVTLSYSVSDGTDSTATSLAFALAAVNDAPELTGTAATLPDGTVNASYSVNEATLLQGWSDIENDSLSVSNPLANNVSSINFSDGVFTIVPETGFSGIITLSYDVTDGSDTTPAELSFSIGNHAPVLVNPLTDQAVKYGTNWSYDAGASFSDDDGDILSYSATLANGDSLPAWMQFNTSNGQISGVPGFGDRGTYALTITATDPSNASIDVPLTVAVTVFNAGQLLVSTSGNDTLTGTIANDTATYALAAGAVTVSLALATAQDTLGAGSDTLSNIDNLIGSDANDNLTGSGGANVLDGGFGADQLAGGAGNDSYVIDNAGDVITETNTGGTDLVLTRITLAGLATNIENLTLLGSDNVNANGNTLANILTGNSGNNSLNGKSGKDKMIGGTGDDTYYVDNANDVVTENTDEGNDGIQTTVTYTLAVNVENLTLMNSLAISGTGNALANILTGNKGNNTLSGLAGNDTLLGDAGNDVLNGGPNKDQVTGGAGTDTFRLSAVADSGVGSDNRDIIRDFNETEADKIDLSSIDAKSATSKNDAFTWRGTAVFSGAAGELRYFYDSGSNITIMEGTVNADKVADFQIELAGNISLSAVDIVL